MKALPAFGAAKLEIQSGDKREPMHISLEELEQVAEALPDYAELVVRFLYVTGMRVNDALRLTWADVNREEGWIRFYVSKTDEWRELPLIAPLADLLHRLDEQRATVAKATERIPERLFVNAKGKTVTYSMLRKPWARARIAGTRMHDLRASCVTNLHTAGIPDSQSRHWTGHKSVAVHAGYDVGSRVALGEIGRQYSALLVRESSA